MILLVDLFSKNWKQVLLPVSRSRVLVVTRIKSVPQTSVLRFKLLRSV